MLFLCRDRPVMVKVNIGIKEGANQDRAAARGKEKVAPSPFPSSPRGSVDTLSRVVQKVRGIPLFKSWKNQRAVGPFRPLPISDSAEMPTGWSRHWSRWGCSFPLSLCSRAERRWPRMKWTFLSEINRAYERKVLPCPTIPPKSASVGNRY
jgi:hypothetical protein